MKKLIHIVLWLGMCFFTYGVSADKTEMGIATGSEAGTYYKFGQDMSKLVSQHGIELSVYPSRGSVENMLAVYDSRSIQLGIAQFDVLFFMNNFGDPKAKEIVKELKVVLPLYQEEVHLLATKDTERLADLEGKKVAIGKAGSGTAMTADVLFALSKVEPSNKVEIGGAQAVEALRQGGIDAMLYVAGYPITLLQEKVSAGDNLHLVPLAEESIVELYGPTSVIPALTYPWQDKDVETVGIMALLMTLDYKSDDVNCDHVGEFTKLVRNNVDWLKENGHDKWKTIDLEMPVEKSIQSPCAAQGS